MSSLISNLNEILDIKEEIKDVIGTESDLFQEYPQLISNAIATGGQADLSYYVSKDELSACGYITGSEIAAMGYITSADIPSVDLSAYVNKSELSAQAYISSAEIAAMGYITSSDAESIVNDAFSEFNPVSVNDFESALQLMDGAKADKSELNSYVSKTELSNCGYITIADIPGVDTSTYVTRTELSNQSYVTETYMFTYLSQWGQSGTYNLVDRVVGLEDKTTQLDNRTAYVESYILSYDTRIQNLENAGYVTQTSLSNNSYASTTYVVDYVNTYAASTVDLTNYVTKNDLSSQSYLTSIPSTYATYAAIVNMSYVTQNDLASRGFLTQHQDLSAYATIAYVTSKVPEEIDLSLYPTYAYLYSYVGAVVGDIETLLANI